MMNSFGHGLLDALALPQIGRSRRISSNEQPNWNDGNFDMTVLLPGQELELPVLQGPGCIRHIWMTSHAGGVAELDSVNLRIYWDGRSEPGVEVPLGDFFAVGQGTPAVVESVPVQVSPTGSLTCFWTMPFKESARIVVRNDNADRTTGLYWQVDWTQLSGIPDDTPYFHARYRQEYPARSGRDYVIADIAGRGQYVGTVMSITLSQDGWFGEGDDFFYIDGEEVPSLQGTGSEDYFNDAWGFRTRTGHWFGQPRWQGDRAGDSGVCYRWHILDPVIFERSLRVAIEHKGNRAESEDSWYVERPDFISSVAFWYQTGEPAPHERMPEWPARRPPWENHHLVRAFRQARTTDGSRVAVSTEGFFGGRPVLVWSGSRGSLAIPFTLGAPGRRAMRLSGFTSEKGGRFDIYIDGATADSNVNFRTSEWEDLDLQLGTHDLDVGVHTLELRLVGGSEDEFSLAVEALRALPLPPEAVRSPKNNNEAHFIRLGIGRAAYAYRLANGELPETLEALAASGIMPKRYLQDENHRSLRSWREGEYLVAESTAVHGWKHRWLGLDARR
ncbi:MAG TPA: glycoside hydrolase family 172 protein [Armatimonadota bacterium]|nr:glycoside hydrolase family 172 protein [Armatimonadota bacterium]